MRDESSRAQAEIISRNLDRGADLNKESEWGKTPLGEAALMGDEDMVQFLIEKGADPNRGLRGGCFNRRRYGPIPD